MTIWFITRHPGAIEWAARHGIAWDRYVPHLDPEEVAAGDTVIGSLPVHLAAAICARGASYFNLSLDMPAHLRGWELDADVLEACGARLEKYFVKKETP
ncbi:CRISPR-associated protein Csx16 [Nitrosomonas sp. HPC101]|uniref:CRISPR-associated protein Csx16 n=1 Tax=Nitrosomonas sp. HPC101 TaxID=1658667 RepID=UPI00136F51CA|nr:CRISPR-associated protein Csx16 [Nitrosomonas sp. HPC101]MXS85656.1 CRISPR-associated protein Csx16 [Nitrosomonas sp. HPC101]